MVVAAVDSNVVIDYKDTSSGARPERAQAIVYAIDRGDRPTARVTNYVLLETLNWIHERQRRDIAVDLRNRLSRSAGFEPVHSVQKDFHRAVDTVGRNCMRLFATPGWRNSSRTYVRQYELFEAYEGLAFGDTTIAAYIGREGIEYLYSFDEDFDALEHVTRLDTPETPFT